MKQINKNRKARTTTAVETDWRIVMVVVVCGVALAAGFFFAARQHFLSMDVGFKNSKLRKQLEDLESEKRRLLLAREMSLSPVELRKASKNATASGELRSAAQQVAFRPAKPEVRPQTVAIKPATALLAKPKPAPVQRADNDARASLTGSLHRSVEIAAAINLR